MDSVHIHGPNGARTDAHEFKVCVLGCGCPVQAIVMAFSFDGLTLWSWRKHSSKHCQPLDEWLVGQPPDSGQIQAEGIRMKIEGLIVRIALAISVPMRLSDEPAPRHASDAREWCACVAVRWTEHFWSVWMAVRRAPMSFARLPGIHSWATRRLSSESVGWGRRC